MKFLKATMLAVLFISFTSCLKNGEDYSANKADGEAFLETVKTQDGVITSDSGSGLLYEIIEEGTGEIPVDGDVVTYDFLGTDITGQVFLETEEDSPLEGYINNYFLGMTEGLKLMSVGSTYKFYLPYYLAHGIATTNYEKLTIDPYSAIVCEIKLVDINRAKRDGIAFLAANKELDGVITTDSGLQYEVLTEGSGDNAVSTSSVTVHYHGTYIDGTVFDSSVDRGTPASFYANQVIKGWTEGLQLMNQGAKFKFYIPYELAYGEAGYNGIPPHSALIFEIELITIN
ncbi:FKBP-type peptidyl-prolyl cis-trans isomerase [Flavicella sediminum]|uniref:FKBP-type peptidyl-prolyl cis-trans isomerase n=1 Tax=Flavicella sediminum TaxID=2585141 RepID=UPI0011219161|nr:FKBP-type peptidyl-prolyl cis-trans isomerase [Flavicella sediminum]